MASLEAALAQLYMDLRARGRTPDIADVREVAERYAYGFAADELEAAGYAHPCTRGRLHERAAALRGRT